MLIHNLLKLINHIIKYSLNRKEEDRTLNFSFGD
jgi:hypothetical protein